MKARAEAISITMTKAEGVKLRAQIVALCGGNSMRLYDADMKNSPLQDLFTLLGGQFENSTDSVNFVSGQL